MTNFEWLIIKKKPAYLALCLQPPAKTLAFTLHLQQMLCWHCHIYGKGQKQGRGLEACAHSPLKVSQRRISNSQFFSYTFWEMEEAAETEDERFLITDSRVGLEWMFHHRGPSKLSVISQERRSPTWAGRRFTWPVTLDTKMSWRNC